MLLLLPRAALTRAVTGVLRGGSNRVLRFDDSRRGAGQPEERFSSGGFAISVGLASRSGVLLRKPQPRLGLGNVRTHRFVKRSGACKLSLGKRCRRGAPARAPDGSRQPFELPLPPEEAEREHRIRE